jgi:hypothetical protein
MPICNGKIQIKTSELVFSEFGWKVIGRSNGGGEFGHSSILDGAIVANLSDNKAIVVKYSRDLFESTCQKCVLCFLNTISSSKNVLL